MDCLYCNPCVFVIGNEYEILIVAKKNGVFSLRVGDSVYYEDNSGVLSSEKNFAKIRVPQEKLDETKEYTINYKETLNRKAYYSELGAPQTQAFSFKPLTKRENINIYHIADVHYRFENAKKTADFFGADTDLFIVNGDIGEVETVENYLEVCKFVGDIAKGEIPVVFVRGNHDTRGKLAEKFTDYFPANGKNTYFDFSLGSLYGIALDCGEDKWDNHKEYGAMEYYEAKSPEVYGGVNVFESWRRKETAFLKSLEKSDKLTFAVSHICPAQTAQTPDSPFAIEQDLYREWNSELARLGTAFMVSGHMHKAYILQRNDKRSLLPHEYPVVVGSACYDEEVWGTAIVLNKTEMKVCFTDSNKQVKEAYTVDFKTGDYTRI
jgi:predicted phosphodiesterase